MTLRDAIEQYIAWRQTHGTRFETGAVMLRAFAKNIDRAIDCDSVTDAQIEAYLAGNGRLTPYRANKYGALLGFYRYAITRGYARRWPLPENEPKKPLSAPPYVYSSDELRRLFAAINDSRRRGFQLDARTFRMLLLLLYGAGLRLGEARRLTLRDVDLARAVLTVRNTKFYKSRLVPVAPRLADALGGYAECREQRPAARGGDSSFLANRDGTPLVKETVRTAFARLLHAAGIHATDDARQSPCMHSLRHTFAVNQLTAWYRQGADVERLLPALSTYLGHKDLAGTQVYLSMTPELLQEASLRFERYVNGGSHG